MKCPAHTDLVEYAFGASDPTVRRRIARHLQECASCRGELNALRRMADSLREVACLSDDELAGAAEGGSGARVGRRLAHVAVCDSCSRRLADLEHLLRDQVVAAELLRLGHISPEEPRRRAAPRYMAAAAALAVAVLGGVMLRSAALPGPGTLQEEASLTHREPAITTTAAPRIRGPVGPAVASDSLTWTHVPHADRYRIRVFDREGTLVWDAYTTDTAAAIPSHLSGATETAYLWKVDARTGWDRWVASEWRDLVIRPETLSR
jgi:hypothetical protein